MFSVSPSLPPHPSTSELYHEGISLSFYKKTSEKNFKDGEKKIDDICKKVEFECGGHFIKQHIKKYLNSYLHQNRLKKEEKSGGELSYKKV